MKRFMVCLGFGSLILLMSTLLHAEMPVTVGSGRAAPSNLTVTSAITWHSNLQSGWRESRRRGIPMLIYITTDKCVYCSAMKRDTWCDASVRRRVAKRFVGVRLTPKANAKTLSRIKIPSYPMTLAGSPDGKIIGHRQGYQPPEQLHLFLGEVSASLGNQGLRAGNIH